MEETKIQSEAFLSPYIMGGRNQEHIKIQELVAKSDTEFLSIANIENPYTSETDVGGYHFSVNQSLMMTVQCAICFAHHLNSSQVKENETFLTNYEISCHKPIRKSENIQIQYNQISKSQRKKSRCGEWYRQKICWNFSVEDDAFNGKIELQFSFAVK